MKMPEPWTDVPTHHLRDGEGSDGLYTDGDIEHLCGDQSTVTCALHAGQLHQHTHVPAGENRI